MNPNYYVPITVGELRKRLDVIPDDTPVTVNNEQVIETELMVGYWNGKRETCNPPGWSYKGQKFQLSTFDLSLFVYENQDASIELPFGESDREWLAKCGNTPEERNAEYVRLIEHYKTGEST